MPWILKLEQNVTQKTDYQLNTFILRLKSPLPHNYGKKKIRKKSWNGATRTVHTYFMQS
jgi:hypothetical protein